jgi:hypothetical protein
MLVLHISLYFRLHDDDDLFLKHRFQVYVHLITLLFAYVGLYKYKYLIVCNVRLYLPRYQTTAIQL